ncbi:MAG: dihydropteroate synthase [Mycobacteriales bacterium]
MGIVNVTPDSFSDGGAFFDVASAVRHGLGLVNAGADLVDVGGESTRPGAEPVPPEEERRRVEPVVAALAAAGVVVSIDTTRARTAEVALGAGAQMVNDVSGGRADPQLARVVAEAHVPYVITHSRGTSATMQNHASYADVLTEVSEELRRSIDRALAAGVDPQAIVVDPGLGFAKTAPHNWTLLAGLPALLDLGRPVLIGASRKSFLGHLLASKDASPRPVGERDHATAAVTALVAAAGAWGVRVHEARASADAVRVAAALRRAASRPGPGSVPQ